jgi:hypothetical protein
MMSDVFEIKLRLDGASMTEFGGFVALVCVQFPALVIAEIDHLLAASADPKLELSAFWATLQQLRDRATDAAKFGDGVATIIGMCSPRRIDGGPVQ